MALEMSFSPKILEWASLFHNMQQKKSEKKCFIKSFDKNEAAPFSLQNNIERFCSKILVVVGSFFGLKMYRVDVQLQKFCELAGGMKEKDIKIYVKTSDRKRIGDVFSELLGLTEYLQDRGKKKECTSAVSALQEFKERFSSDCARIALSLIQERVKECSVSFSDKGKIVFSQTGKNDFIVEKEIVDTYGIQDKELRQVVLKEVYKEKLPAVEAWVQEKFASWTNSESLFQKKSDQIKQILDLAMGSDDALVFLKKEIDGIFEKVRQNRILQVVQNLPKDILLETIHAQLNSDKKIGIEINAQKIVSSIFSEEKELQSLLKNVVEEHIKHVIKGNKEIQESLLFTIVAEYEKGFKAGKKCGEKELNEIEGFYNTFVDQVQAFLPNEKCVLCKEIVVKCLACLEKKHVDLLKTILIDEKKFDRACAVHLLLKEKKCLDDFAEEIKRCEGVDAKRGSYVLLILDQIIDESEKKGKEFKRDVEIEKLVLEVRQGCERIGRAISRVVVEVKDTTVASGGILLANTKVGQVIQRSFDDGKKPAEQSCSANVRQISQAIPVVAKSAFAGAAWGLATDFSINGAIRGAFWGAGLVLIPLAVTQAARKAKLKYYLPEVLGVATSLFLLVGPKNIYSFLTGEFGIAPSFDSKKACGWNPFCVVKKARDSFMTGVRIKNVGDAVVGGV